MFVEGWQAYCDAYARRHGHTVGSAYDARMFSGGRWFCAKFLDQIQRHGGDITLAAQDDGIDVGWERARRYLRHTRTPQADAWPEAGKGGRAWGGAQEGKGQGGKRPAQATPWHREQQPRR